MIIVLIYNNRNMRVVILMGLSDFMRIYTNLVFVLMSKLKKNLKVLFISNFSYVIIILNALIIQITKKTINKIKLLEKKTQFYK